MPISIITRLKGRSRGTGATGSPFPSYDPNAGTQICKRDLKFTIKTIVRLDPSVFDVPGTFTLFTYNTFYVQPGATAQQHLNIYLELDDSLLTRVKAQTRPVIDTVAKKITVTLVNR